MDKKKFIYTALVVCFALVFICVFVSVYATGMQPAKIKNKGNIHSQENLKNLVSTKQNNIDANKRVVNADIEITTDPNNISSVEETPGIKLQGFAEKYQYSINKGISFNMITASTVSKVKLKGEKLRIETTIQNQKNIVILSDGIAYSYQPRTGIAMKIDTASVSKDTKLSSDTISQISDNSAKTTIKNGYACLMYKLNVSDEVCISERFNIPVYMNVSGNVTNFTDITTANISDSDFKLPGNIKVMDMNNLKNILQTGMATPESK